jgi:5-methylcytosine-specific restriction endonuclease McrA
MGKKKESTPRSKVKSTLRQLSLRCRERADAMKREHYTCERCGIKQSKAKGKEVSVEAHHRHGLIEWEKLIDEVYRVLLVPSSQWEILCKDCHSQETNSWNENERRK